MPVDTHAISRVPSEPAACDMIFLATNGVISHDLVKLRVSILATC